MYWALGSTIIWALWLPNPVYISLLLIFLYFVFCIFFCILYFFIFFVFCFFIYFIYFISLYLPQKLYNIGKLLYYYIHSHNVIFATTINLAPFVGLSLIMFTSCHFYVQYIQWVFSVGEIEWVLSNITKH